MQLLIPILEQYHRKKAETASLPKLAWPRRFVELGELSKVGG
jgi:hypothetical protein